MRRPRRGLPPIPGRRRKALPRGRGRRVPLRTCVRCGAVKEKGALLRIAGRVGGDWTPDPGGKLPGRGIWICRTIECIEGFRRRLSTPKGGARWKMGDRGAGLAARLGEFLPATELEKNTGCVDGEDPDS